MIPVFKPRTNKKETLPELEKIFDSGWIGLEPKTGEFEKNFADYIELSLHSCEQFTGLEIMTN